MISNERKMQLTKKYTAFAYYNSGKEIIMGEAIMR